MKYVLPKKLTLQWTQHIKEKMRHYGLSESRIKRVMNHPTRLEEGIAPNTTAAMQPVTKQKRTTQEIWVMYQDRGAARVMITAWRYPGKSPNRGAIPIPDDIRNELGIP
jgi:hypothetical protein